MNESAFFQDLAMLMTAAGIVSVVFTRLKWPKVIGYIVAGLFLSKNTWGGCWLADESSVQIIGQLGVVFLMFSMGLDFSLRDMQRIKNVTLPTAIIDTVMMTWLGYTVGTRILGWAMLPSLFLGAAICDSATTMLAKVIDEMQWGKKPFVKYTLGTSVCEDIVCVGIIALITGVATGKGMDLGAAVTSMGGLVTFFLAVIVFGFVLVPRLLKSVAKRKDDEVLVLTILGCLFFVSYVAFRLQYSLALGAFLVGILGAASDVRHRVAELTAPLRSMFAAVFFVSIGLLVDPGACWAYLPTILLVSAVVIVGKFINCTLGGLLTGETVRTSVQMGMSLAQIGEFAFMVAMIYIACSGVSDSPMYQIVVAASLITTLVNPLFIRWSEPVGSWVESKVPSRISSVLATYRGFIEKYRHSGGSERLRKYVRRVLIQLGVLAVLQFSVSTACGNLYRIDYSRFSQFFEDHDRVFFFIVVNIFALLLLPMILRMARALGRGVSIILVTDKEKRWQQAFRQLIVFLVTTAVLVCFFVESMMINVNLVPANPWLKWGAAILLVTLAGVGWRFFTKAGHRATERFREALGAEERREKLAKAITITLPEGTLHRLPLDLNSPAVGGNVVSLNIRAKTGASIVSIDRGGESIRNIGPETEFQVGDVLVAVGGSGQIAALKDLLGITG